MVDRNSQETRRTRAEAAARETLAISERQLAQRDGEPPRRGDLYALSAGAEAGIEWLVTSDPADGRVTLAAADGMPLVGALDHRVDASAPAGPQVLRGAAVRSVAVDLLPAARRVGVVLRSHVDRFQQRLEDPSAVDATAEEVSSEPEYRAWVEERLKPALEALEALDRARSLHHATRGPGPSWWGLAASMALAVLAGWVVNEMTRAPAQAPPGGEVAMAFFAPQVDVTRSTEATVVEWAPDLPSAVLAFRTLTPEAYPAYQLELIDRNAEETAPSLWSRSGLRLQGASEIVVLVPVEVLVGRNVEAQLFGLPQTDGAETEAKRVPLERWRFRLAER
ncbi:MAG: hypothetical protein AAGM22_19680 [Acidobacteriota bacterium]